METQILTPTLLNIVEVFESLHNAQPQFYFQLVKLHSLPYTQLFACMLCVNRCLCVFLQRVHFSVLCWCIPSEVCSQFWVGVSQTAKRPTGKFPISTLQCRLTTKGSEIHSTAQHSLLSASLRPSASPNILCNFLILCSPQPLIHSLSVSPDESEQRWKAFRNAGRQTVLYSNLTWRRWKPAGMLGIELGWERWGNRMTGWSLGEGGTRRDRKAEDERAKSERRCE